VATQEDKMKPSPEELNERDRMIRERYWELYPVKRPVSKVYTALTREFHLSQSWLYKVIHHRDGQTRNSLTAS